MNTPLPAIHIIDTNVEPGYAIRLSIPSPFGENTIINVIVELYPQENQMLYAEVWGDLPRCTPDKPDERGKFATGFIPFPDTEPASFADFIDAIMAELSKSDFFVHATTALLKLHHIFGPNK